MGQVIIRKLDDAVIAAHKRRAAARGVSLEQQLRDVLAEAAKPSREELLERLAACRALTPPGARTLAEDLIREHRDSRWRSWWTRAWRSNGSLTRTAVLAR